MYSKFKKILEKLSPVSNDHFEDGHFHSPIPSQDDLKKLTHFEYNGIDMKWDQQLDLLSKISIFYKDISFKETVDKNDGSYYYLNRYFSYSDAILTWCLTRYIKPNKIIEIGSGYSTKVFNTCIDFYKLKTDLLSIDVIKNSEAENHLNLDVRSVDIESFASLKTNDILFIDTSHVSKAGSDLNYLLFKVLPSLNSGVVIHFHDIFRFFEYPKPWLDEKIYWNEQYLVRAFLMYNKNYEIIYFSDEMEHRYESWFKKNMPLCLAPHEKYTVGPKKGQWIHDLRGQSLWLRKK